MEPVRKRLKHASEQLELFISKFGEVPRNANERLVTEVNEDATRYLVRIRNLGPPIPLQWALILGDSIHNMRAMLDNLAFQLAIAFTQWPLPKDIHAGSAFPIFTDGSEFTNKGWWRTKGMHPDARALIKDLQPYHGGNPASGTEEAIRHALHVIHVRDIQDKHRAPNLVGKTVGGLTMTGANFQNLDYAWVNFDGLEENAVVAEYVFRSPNPEMHVRPKTWTDVSFEEAVPLILADGSRVSSNTSVESSMHWCLERMEDLLSMFESFI